MNGTAVVVALVAFIGGGALGGLVAFDYGYAKSRGAYVDAVDAAGRSAAAALNAVAEQSRAEQAVAVAAAERRAEAGNRAKGLVLEAAEDRRPDCEWSDDQRLRIHGIYAAYGLDGNAPNGVSDAVPAPAAYGAASSVVGGGDTEPVPRVSPDP